MKLEDKLKLLDEKLDLHGRDKKDFYIRMITNARDRIQKEYNDTLSKSEDKRD